MRRSIHYFPRNLKTKAKMLKISRNVEENGKKFLDPPSWSGSAPKCNGFSLFSIYGSSRSTYARVSASFIGSSLCTFLIVNHPTMDKLLEGNANYNLVMAPHSVEIAENGSKCHYAPLRSPLSVPMWPLEPNGLCVIGRSFLSRWEFPLGWVPGGFWTQG